MTSPNQSSNINKKFKADDEHEEYGDPTFDVTFKMLFGSEENKDILINLLNSLLNFEGLKRIIEVEINTNELPVYSFSEEKGESGITGSVGILCTNVKKQKIAYIIVISKENIFAGKTELKDQAIFEIDVKPFVLQTNQIIPDNKMNWKFFELPKFKKSDNFKKINCNSPLKDQWLEFLVDCSNQKKEPERNEIIKKAYVIMRISQWTGDMQTLYWKSKMREKEAQEALELANEEGMELGREKGREEGREEMKKEMQKLAMSGLMKSTKNETSHEMNVELFSMFTGKQISIVEEHIKENQNCTVDQLVSLLE